MIVGYLDSLFDVYGKEYYLHISDTVKNEINKNSKIWGSLGSLLFLPLKYQNLFRSLLFNKLF
jgi:hypothetical protein